jgi:hypothetical protein
MRHPIIAVLAVLLILHVASGQAIRTQVVQQDGTWQLLRDDKPYFIKGIGGDGSRKLAVDLGANSLRTWGPEGLDAKLAEAQKLGMTVTVGIWLGQERHKFDYRDTAKVAEQFEKARKIIEKYKDHPAVLMWGIGNEMEGRDGDNPLIWKAVNDIAKLAKEIDPNHPTMTVMAELGGKRIESVHKLCPDIDIVGINSYAGAPSIPARYKKGGGTKPYVVTEFGPVGTWETPRNDFDVIPEPTSTAKGAAYRQSYKSAIASQPGLCLGSYVFAWGNKQEATATWFGMMLPDGSRLEAVDAMCEMWTGKPPTNRVPQIEPLKLQGSDHCEPGAMRTVLLNVSDPENDPLKIIWELHRETEVYKEGGDFEPATAQFADAIVNTSDDRAEVRLPGKPGAYRLYAFARDNHGGAATANITLLVTTDAAEKRPTSSANPKLPMILLADPMKSAPYTPSGWMGNIEAIAMDPNSPDSPHSGKACLKATYKAKDNFGGVVWQDPANDWGDMDGGHDLSGAAKLIFWARGAKGGEKVEFKFGVLEKGKAFHDTASGAMTVELTSEWKEYSFDLSGKDLTKIKTGFCWVVAGQGDPVVFYLDDISYQP